MKLFTRVEKRDEKLIKLYEQYVAEGMKPQRAAERAREEVSKVKK